MNRIWLIGITLFFALLGEARARHARSAGAPVVWRHNFNVLMSPSAVTVFVLNPHVGDLH